MLAFALTIIFSFWNPYKTSNLYINFFPISEPDEDCSEDDKDLDDDTSVTDISESLSSDSCSDLDIPY